MTREQQLVGVFVELADTLIEEFDVLDFLHVVSERCVELLDCVEAGVLMADPAGMLRVMASSSERTDALDLLQSQNEEGPCFECFQHGNPVISEDLAADIDRWPLFAPAALERGFGSMHALPMRVRGDTIGALNLFRAEPGAIAGESLPVGQGMADIAALALIQERALRESHTLVDQLQGALTSRVVIEQAKGLLAERAHIGLEEAFRHLRHHARSHNHHLSDVAREMIDGKIDVATLISRK